MAVAKKLLEYTEAHKSSVDAVMLVNSQNLVSTEIRWKQSDIMWWMLNERKSSCKISLPRDQKNYFRSFSVVLFFNF